MLNEFTCENMISVCPLHCSLLQSAIDSNNLSAKNRQNVQYLLFKLSFFICLFLCSYLNIDCQRTFRYLPRLEHLPFASIQIRKNKFKNHVAGTPFHIRDPPRSLFYLQQNAQDIEYIHKMAMETIQIWLLKHKSIRLSILCIFTLPLFFWQQPTKTKNASN